MTPTLEQALYSLRATADDCAEECDDARAELLRSIAATFELDLADAVTAEREACAEIADEIDSNPSGAIAARIRKRSNVGVKAPVLRSP